MQVAGAPSNYKRCEVRSTPEREKKARDAGWFTPHAIPLLEKLPMANRISLNTRIDPARSIWRRVWGGYFIQEIPFSARTRELNCTARDLEVVGTQDYFRAN